MKECETLAHTYADLIKVTNYINLLVFSIPFDKATSAYVRPIYYVAINCFYLSMVISFLSIVSNMVNNPWIDFFTATLVYVSFWQNYFTIANNGITNVTHSIDCLPSW